MFLVEYSLLLYTRGQPVLMKDMQQGNEAKPIVTTSNRNSKFPGDIELGNPNCPKKGKGSWKSKNKGKGFNNSSLCWW